MCESSEAGAAYYPVLVATYYYLLLTTYYLLPTTYYLLPTPYSLLPTTYYLPRSIHVLPAIRQYLHRQIHCICVSTHLPWESFQPVRW